MNFRNKKGTAKTRAGNGIGFVLSHMIQTGLLQAGAAWSGLVRIFAEETSLLNCFSPAQGLLASEVGHRVSHTLTSVSLSSKLTSTGGHWQGPGGVLSKLQEASTTDSSLGKQTLKLSASQASKQEM